MEQKRRSALQYIFVFLWRQFYEKYGVGLADCAIAESKFEKGEDVSARVLSLIPSLNEIRQKGTPDMEFAVGGLIARSQLANGKS